MMRSKWPVDGAKRIGWLAAMLLVALTASCRQPTPVAPANKESTAGNKEPVLRVMIVDDAPLAETIQRHWRAHTESELAVTLVTADQAAVAEQLPVDAVIYPPALVGQFAMAELLLPLEENLLSEPEYRRDEIFPGLLRGECSWGGKLVALPLGSPQLVLLYRADLFAAAELKPPTTWAEFAQVIEHFREPPKGLEPAPKHWLAAAEPLANGWGAKLLLARGAAGARHRDQLSSLWTFDMEPLIAGPPWVRALEELKATQEATKEAPALSPQDCFAKLIAGECALAITWPQTLAEGNLQAVKAEQLGVAALPGSRDVYHPDRAAWELVPDGATVQVATQGLSGRVASVSRATAQAAAARRFLLWLTGPEVSGTVSPASHATAPFRAGHNNQTMGWRGPAELAPLLSQYADVVAAGQQEPRNLLTPRIPGQADYLSALDRAVLATVKGEAAPADALQTAAKGWREITQRLGPAEQRRALRVSLGVAN